MQVEKTHANTQINYASSNNNKSAPEGVRILASRVQSVPLDPLV
jgi:hypothetical protein